MIPEPMPAVKINASQLKVENSGLVLPSLTLPNLPKASHSRKAKMPRQTHKYRGPKLAVMALRTVFKKEVPLAGLINMGTVKHATSVREMANIRLSIVSNLIDTLLYFLRFQPIVKIEKIELE